MMARAALVTGGARGIGRSTVERLLRDGFAVVIGDLDEAMLANTVQALKARNLSVYGLRCDVTRADDVQSLIHEIDETLGRLDVLVNNAGIIIRTQFFDIGPEEWDRVQAVNLKGAFLCAQAAAKLMSRQRWGRIVNLSSMAARTGGQASAAHYAASKAGLIGLTKALARALGPYGITVNAVCPGIIESEMTRDLAEEQRRFFKQQIPLGRLGTPEDVADVISFLVSDDSRYVTGATIDINGGYYTA